MDGRRSEQNLLQNFYFYLNNFTLCRAGVDNYNLDAILKKKRKNLYNRLHAAGEDISQFIMVL